MKTRNTQNTDTKTIVGPRYDADSLAKIAMKIKAEGFVPAAVLKDEFGPDIFTQSIAVLFRDLRIFREARRPWKDGESVLGYEWADRRFSQSEVKKIHPELGFAIELTKQQLRYTDFEPITVRCRWTAPILGSVPIKDEHEDPTNVFERDSLGQVLILRYGLRAMATRALQMIGKEMSIAHKIGFSTIRIPNPAVKIVEHGIVENGRPGGKGLRRSECIQDGLEFTIRALVPTSMLTLDEFLRMLKFAGQYVGLSPGRSAGFGDFEVLEVLGTE